MGLSAAMEIGKNGLNIYRVATEVTGENIANVNTPGYSRQRVILETAPPTTANGFPLGTGVHIATVERYYDSLLQQQMVNAHTTQGYDTTKSTVLQQIEPSFNEVAQDGLGAAVSNFYASWQDLTLNPAGSAERQAVLSRAQILVDNFNSVSKSLNDSIATQNASLVPQTQDINQILGNIAQLNGQIKTTELVSGNANETRDQRDQLVRDLSQKIGITYTENSDGTTDIKLGANNLVVGSTAGLLSLVPNGSISDVYVTQAGGGAAAILVPQPSTGQLGATLALRDTIIPGYLAKVDTLAMTIANQVNTQHKLGFDLNGLAGINFFDPAATNAATMAINPLLTSTKQIAASGSALLAADSSNALTIAKQQNALTMLGGTATFNSYFDGLVSQIGLDVRASKTTLAQDEAFTKQLTSLRESNSGVSLDEELTNLVKYQRSYQASAKLISTATDMMDIVIGMVR
ncbi:MAG TPA: flagellar hook-associated protein FlgK [Desulfuromonadaceae bacterium]